jgi:IclR family acetate operon transcriptional repressor
VNAKLIDESAAAGRATGGAKALVKGIAIVNLLASNRHGLRLTDLVRELDLPRATTIRLLEALCAAHLVRAGADGRYRLGPRCAVWGSDFVSSLELRDAAADLMTHLVDVSNETCHLGICEARSVLYIHKVECAHSLRMVSRVGGTNPLHSTGLGKAILAFLPEVEQEEYLALPLERRTPNTIVDAQMLRAELSRIRANGYAVDDVENELGVCCIGAPIFDHDGKLVGSLSLSGPTIRMSWERMEQLTSLVVDAAGTVSGRLGYGLSSQPSRFDPNGKTEDQKIGSLSRRQRSRSAEQR